LGLKGGIVVVNISFYNVEKMMRNKFNFMLMIFIFLRIKYFSLRMKFISLRRELFTYAF